jgi:hypothetical protein
LWCNDYSRRINFHFTLLSVIEIEYLKNDRWSMANYCDNNQRLLAALGVYAE